jgi:hypothetical protein
MATKKATPKKSAAAKKAPIKKPVPKQEVRAAVRDLRSSSKKATAMKTKSPAFPHKYKLPTGEEWNGKGREFPPVFSEYAKKHGITSQTRKTGAKDFPVNPAWVKSKSAATNPPAAHPSGKSMKQLDYKTLDSLVSSAVITKRTSALVKALADGLDPDSPDPERNGRTFLFNYHITPAVAEALLAAGADASYTDANGYQPLHSANATVVALLLAAGADIEVREPRFGVTPLIAHAMRGDANMVKFLLEQGADVLARYNNHSNDIIGAAASSASDPNSFGGRDKIYRLVERCIADGLVSRRFMLRSLKDLRTASRGEDWN